MPKKEIIDIKRIKDELGNEVERLVGKKELAGFKKFAFKGHMIQMAIAFMLGAAFNNVVTSISQNLIMPCINYIVDKTGSDWREYIWRPVTGLELEIGGFLGAFVDFIIMSAILYIAYKKLLEPIMMPKEKPELKVQDKIECQFCLTQVHYQAAVCSSCGRWLNNPYAKEQFDYK